VGLYTELFYAIIPIPCFYAFCWSAIPTSCYILFLYVSSSVIAQKNFTHNKDFWTFVRLLWQELVQPNRPKLGPGRWSQTSVEPV